MRAETVVADRPRFLFRVVGDQAITDV